MRAPSRTQGTEDRSRLSSTRKRQGVCTGRRQLPWHLQSQENQHAWARLHQSPRMQWTRPRPALVVRTPRPPRSKPPHTEQHRQCWNLPDMLSSQRLLDSQSVPCMKAQFRLVVVRSSAGSRRAHVLPRECRRRLALVQQAQDLRLSATASLHLTAAPRWWPVSSLKAAQLLVVPALRQCHLLLRPPCARLAQFQLLGRRQGHGLSGKSLRTSHLTRLLQQ